MDPKDLLLCKLSKINKPNQSNAIIMGFFSSHETAGEYLYSLDDPSHHWKGWLFSNIVNSTEGQMSNDDFDAECPEDVQMNWDVFDGFQWFSDPTMKVKCDL